MENRHWLMEQMNPYFFIAMKDEAEALALLEREMGTLRHNRRLVLADRDKSFIQAMPNMPGSLYDTLRRIPEREISYALIAHSEGPLPGQDTTLEIQRFEFDRKSNQEIQQGMDTVVPADIKGKIAAALKRHYPDFERGDLERLLRIIWLNNENYVRVASPERVAQILHLFQKGNQGGGLHLDVEPVEDGQESRVHFAVGNPPQKDFLLQLMEVFNRLDLGVNRAYCLTISNGTHPYFLGTFYVRRRDGKILSKGSELFSRLQNELCNTQILATASQAYRSM
jgi:glutamate dehydrogenase